MIIAESGDVPRDHSVILLVSGGRVLRLGSNPRIDQEAFRCHQDGISVTWVEFFSGSAEEQLQHAALAMKAGGLTVRKTGVVARARVGDIIDVMAKAGRAVTVCRDRLDHNEAHCLIVGIAPDELGLLLALTDAFLGLVPASTIPGFVS